MAKKSSFLRPQRRHGLEDSLILCSKTLELREKKKMCVMLPAYGKGVHLWNRTRNRDFKLILITSWRKSFTVIDALHYFLLKLHNKAKQTSVFSFGSGQIVGWFWWSQTPGIHSVCEPSVGVQLGLCFWTLEYRESGVASLPRLHYVKLPCPSLSVASVFFCLS